MDGAIMLHTATTDSVAVEIRPDDQILISVRDFAAYLNLWLHVDQAVELHRLLGDVIHPF